MMIAYLYDFQTTDVSGGHSPSVLEAIRQCITASTVMAFSKSDSYKPLTHKDAFKLATLGGSEGIVTNKREMTYCMHVLLYSNQNMAQFGWS